MKFFSENLVKGILAKRVIKLAFGILMFVDFYQFRYGKE